MSEIETRLKGFFSRAGFPAWMAEAVGLAWLVADYYGRLEFWVLITGHIGGGAALMAEVLNNPAIPIILMSLGAYSLWHLTSPRLHEDDKRWLSLTTWVFVSISIASIAFFALFVNFLESGKIPEAIAFFNQEMYVRHISNKQYNDLYKAIRAVPNPLPKFEVASTHNAESLQYATEFMNLFYAAGLKLVNGEAGSAWPTSKDLYSTDVHGLMIGVKNANGPNKPALDLRDAFLAAQMSVHFFTINGEDDADFLFLVGPK